MFRSHTLFILFLLFSSFIKVEAQRHPGLTLTHDGLKIIKKNINHAPLFKITYDEVKTEVDKWMLSGINVPQPKDMPGGFSHEVHKKNYLMLQAAGNIYQISGEKKYASHIHKVLLAYAQLYPGLSKHPSTRSYAPGKIFWQCLNDANWLVYVSQAYDCIYESLSQSERNHLETNLFRPFADFLSIENPAFYNRIHNHSTWGNAAVGMIALVIGDEDLLDRAMYGIKGMSALSEFDNDGGRIEINKKAGFLAQIDDAFSPDGYYFEGPYYQRYALSPFILFSQALANCKPELQIFSYRDHILKKAVTSLINLSDSKGQFFPVNDAQKGMSIHSRELIAAVDAVYFYDGKDPSLLSIAAQQGLVTLDHSGFETARAIHQGKVKPFLKNSINFRDGSDGKGGGISVLRSKSGNREFSCCFKYGVQGSGHGHFDRLSYSLYMDDKEILQDYGSARWVNIDQKQGGIYLKENQTWAKQTIAHNTVTIHEKSQFNGNTQDGELHPSNYFYSDFTNPDIKIVSAKDFRAYEGVELHRTLFMVHDDHFKQPILIDIFGITSDSSVNADLPFHFKTQYMASSFPIDVETTSLKTLGGGSGYQHLWKEGSGKLNQSPYSVTWFSDGIFTTQYGLSEPDDEVIFARIGANDPNFNLRKEPLYIHRKRNKKSPVFINVICSHGDYNPIDEIPVKPYSMPVDIKLICHNDQYTVAEVTTGNKNVYSLMISHDAGKTNQSHQYTSGNEVYKWNNPVSIIKKQK